MKITLGYRKSSAFEQLGPEVYTEHLLYNHVTRLPYWLNKQFFSRTICMKKEFSSNEGNRLKFLFSTNMVTVTSGAKQQHVRQSSDFSASALSSDNSPANFVNLYRGPCCGIAIFFTGPSGA